MFRDSTAFTRQRTQETIPQIVLVMFPGVSGYSPLLSLASYWVEGLGWDFKIFPILSREHSLTCGVFCLQRPYTGSCRAYDSGFCLEDSGFRTSSGFWGLGFRGVRFGLYGLGFEVRGLRDYRAGRVRQCCYIAVGKRRSANKTKKP